jgi:hypothetical protein
MAEEKTNGAAAPAEEKPPPAAPPPPQQITLSNVNGRLAELSDINAQLTARCAMMRGQLADKDDEIARLTQENMVYRQREDAAAKKTVLAKPEKPAKAGAKAAAH